MESQLRAYLDRIGYSRDPLPNHETLVGLHRAHLMAIPYENLDIHLGRTLSLRQDDIYEKMVVHKRGGWCYEMNGLFAWALRAVGFDVRLIASTVNRSATGFSVEGNHLVLLVQLDQPYLADVGFGNGFLEPLPLQTGRYDQGSLSYILSREEDTGVQRWWFQNHRHGGAGYDFTLEGYELEDFTPQSVELQTSPESGFVRTTVCHRHTPDGIITLRGAILRTVSGDAVEEATLENLYAYHDALERLFDLHLHYGETAVLWEKIWARHQQWLSK